MKKQIIGCLCAVLCGIGSLAYAQDRSEMSVQVREGPLRDRPSFLGAVVSTVAYGDRVIVERAQGPWRYVASAGQAGWIHESALTRERIVLTAGEEDVAGVTTQEMALAGKGFNAEVEGEFRAQHEDIDFAWVDYMETLGKSPSRLVQFLRAGGVEPVAREGGHR